VTGGIAKEGGLAPGGAEEGERPQALSSAGRVDGTPVVVVHRRAMAEHRVPEVSDTAAGDGTRTYTSGQPDAGHP
jgi:hypothetical protein